jgi:transcriptional regulator with XRE-family HTH domain
MTPFGERLEQIRRSRGLKQVELAELIDVKASYVSVLERGFKGAPSKFVLKKIIDKLKLSEKEKSLLLYDAAITDFSFKIPPGTTRSEFELLHKLKEHLGSLSDQQVLVMKTILEMGKFNKETEGGFMES